VLLGSFPQGQELELDAVMGGPSGAMIRARFHAAGAGKLYDTATRIHAIACRPPFLATKGDFTEARSNCAPTVALYLGPAHKVITFGDEALRVATGKTSAMKWFGYPLEGLNGCSVFPMFHPFTAMDKPALLPVFKYVMSRAVAWAAGDEGATKTLVWPDIVLDEGDAALDMLDRIRASGHCGFDVETAGVDPIHDPLLAVGFGAWGVGAVSLPWPLRNVRSHDAVRALLADTRMVKYAHNAQHDILSLEAHNLPVRGRVDDTLLQHTALFPQQPHDLGFCCASLFNAPRWKAEFHAGSEEKGSAVFTKSPALELRLYNAKDCLMGDRLGQTLTSLLTGKGHV
jgi:hypothetical protein